MKTLCAIALAGALLGWTSPALAADKCPPEVAQAKALLSQAAKQPKEPRQLAGARQQDIQAPRAQDIQAPRGKQQDVQAPRSQDVQAPRAQDIQAPRSQDIQAPRSQDIQAPRSQDIQAPRSQDIQAPRSQDIQAPRISQARKLVREAEAACKKGNMELSAAKARAAIEILK